MASKRELKYQRKLEALIEQTGQLQDREVAKVFALLEQARLQVANTVVTTEWQAYRVPAMQEAIAAAVDQFQRAYGSTQKDALGNMWEAGQDMIAAPLAEAGFSVAIPQLSRASLEIMQGFSIDLIGGLSADLKKKVVAEIAMGVMGGKSQYEVMQAIGANLSDKGAFKSIAARAESITRTETARVHSLAREARARATIAAAGPGVDWEKRWHSSNRRHPRPMHAGLNGVQIKINDLFLGFIPYPHAPNLSAAEVVNCG